VGEIQSDGYRKQSTIGQTKGVHHATKGIKYRDADYSRRRNIPLIILLVEETFQRAEATIYDKFQVTKLTL
jgi:hypothetical protein